MANKTLFASTNSNRPPANAVNEAGGRAYALEPKHALAQLAATGTFGNAFYTSAEDQLDSLTKLVRQVDDDVFLAKLAVYARTKAKMKDMPAALVCLLSRRNTELMHRVFDRAIDNGRVLRTLFQMVRSGRFGRRGLSSSLQRAFQRWLNEASVGKLISASIGNDPSLRDVLRMARPTPTDDERRAFFGWLTDKPAEAWAPATEADLPVQVRLLDAYRTATTAAEQVRILSEQGLAVRWDLLADAALGTEVWIEIAKKMGPQALRMNLNTLQRHGVFGDVGDGRSIGRAITDALGVTPRDAGADMVDYVAGRIADEDEVRRSGQFPYQYLAAYLNATDTVPRTIRTALHTAAEIACGNVPELPGPVVIGVDTSGSMQMAVTGNRGRGSTSKMRCVDVAALFAAAVLRRNPDSVVVPFDTRAYDVRVDPADSILSLSERLAKFGGGGTDVSIPLREANTTYRERAFAGIVLVSDNESWVHRGRAFGYGRGGTTGVMDEWQRFVENQRSLGFRSPKLVCIDIQPYGTTQAPERPDVLNVGGFGDAVFELVAAFLEEDAGRFVAEVEAVEL